MAEIHPFRGWRYDLSQVGDLSEVTAPPYDVIDNQQQDELYKLHPCNVIRLILNREEPGDESADKRYERAADFLHHWQSEGVLMHERDEALYVYHQDFEWEGTHYVRKGFLARLRLEKFGEGCVFPHEQTMPGPKADRLALTKACKTNLSAIFGLYPDADQAAQQSLEQAIVGQTPLEARDKLGVIHRMWAVTDYGVVSRVREALKDRPVFIADGHHRYETALNYRDWLESQGQLSDDSHAANFVMMMFVGMNDPGLAILPTHRLVTGLPELTASDLRQILENHFELDDVGEGADGANAAWELMQSDGGQGIFGFGTAGDGRWLAARLTDASPMAELAPEQSEEWRGLGVSLLHKFVIDHLLGQRFPEAELKCRYVHLMEEVIAAQTQKTCPLVCLVAPAGIDHVEQIASRFEKMPPKSTFFYPKLRSGLVLNPLE